MAKTESTAVNELINLVQNRKPMPPSDPSGDLFTTPPRMSSTQPASHASGDMPPLPRSRAPQSTAEHARTALPDPRVRMTTAPTTRGSTIPPLPPPSRAPGAITAQNRESSRDSGQITAQRAPSPSLESTVRTRASSPSLASTVRSPSPSPAAIAAASSRPSTPLPLRATSPALPPPVPTSSPAPSVRTSSPALPPPVRTSSPALPPPTRTSSMPPLPPSRVTASVATVPPATAPIAAPFETPAASFAAAAAASPFAAPSRPAVAPPVPRPSELAAAAAAVHAPRGGVPDPFTSKLAASGQHELPPFTAPVGKQQLFNIDETWVGQLPSKRSEWTALGKKIAIPAIACIAAGVGLGFYVSASNKTTPTARPTQAAPTATITPAPKAPVAETVLHPTPRSAESQNAATASAGAEQPQPPTKDEQAATMAAVAAGELTTDAPADAIAKVREVQTQKGTITLADIRIDTEPQGASITLVDRGKQFPLGSTPLATSLDTSRQYDVVIELAGRPAQMVHLDPATTTRLDISLGQQARTVAVAAPAPAAPAVVAAPVAAAVADPVVAKPTKAAPVVATSTKAAPSTKTERTAKTSATAAVTETAVSGLAAQIDAVDSKPAKAAASPAVAAGNGTLMVSSKPPCEILIDGKATGLTTPQRAIDLPAGRHKITFVNADAGIKKTVSVTITADKSTKLIEDLLSK